MGHAENFSNMVAQRMREISDYQNERRSEDLRQVQLAHIRSGLGAAVQSARIGVFEDFDIEKASIAALNAGTRGRQ